MRNPALFALGSSLACLISCASEKPVIPVPPAPAAASATLAPQFVESGFLTADYSRLNPVSSGALRRTYENPDVRLSDYDKLLVDKITVWRDVERAEPVESEDFQKIVDDLYAVFTREASKTFTLVEQPGPGVVRMRIALVAIDDPEDQLDVYVTKGEPTTAESDDPLPPGLREFGQAAWLEAEMLDANTKTVIFAVVDRAADVIPRAHPLESWRDLHEAFVAWAEQASRRLADLKARS